MKVKKVETKLGGVTIEAKENEKGEIAIEVIDSGELTIAKAKEKEKEQNDLIV